MKIVLKIFKWTLTVILAMVLVAVLVCVGLHSSADLAEPAFTPSGSQAVQVGDSLRIWVSPAASRDTSAKTDVDSETETSDSPRAIAPTANPAEVNALRLSESGLWEMRVIGNAFERGEAIGKLAPELLYEQEKAFADKLFEIVPSRSYRKLLHYFITIFNRRLGANVPLEYRQEIKAMSTACTDEFEEFGNAYERQMQYHSAHDIGHVMQDYMLVGCTSFASWGEGTADGNLLIGRNFDFYMGDEFARNKLVMFEKPDNGYAYVSVTWPGMTGVLSGMNTEGLTVTINASKLETPSMSATPISILTKEILQYASDIDEAVRIAASRQTFVSESILIGSAKDGRAAIIEKTPSEMAVYDPALQDADIHRIVCTNHYQSTTFRDNPVNQDNIRMSDSMCRFRRVEQLLESAGTLTPEKVVQILRDKKGLDGEEIGYCNELAINQLLAMHSVVFCPVEHKIWVSTSPWQCGRFVCYDIDKVFASDFRGEIRNTSEDISQDPFMETEDYSKVLEFKELLPKVRKAAGERRQLDEDSLTYIIGLDSLYYGGYNAAGDYFRATGQMEKAREYWGAALAKKMKLSERQYIENKLR